MAADSVTSLKAAQGLNLRKRIDPQEQDKKLHEVARLYEEQFLREMVKAMRQTVPEGGLTKVSQGEQIYREQLDHNYVEQWSKRGGLGLQEMIYQQLQERFAAVLGKTPMAKPQGPLPLDTKANLNKYIEAKIK